MTLSKLLSWDPQRECIHQYSHHCLRTNEKMGRAFLYVLKRLLPETKITLDNIDAMEELYVNYEDMTLAELKAD